MLRQKSVSARKKCCRNLVRRPKHPSSDTNSRGGAGISMCSIRPRSLLKRLLGREATAEEVFGNDTGDHKIFKVLAPAGLGSAAGHLKSAEGLALDNGSGDGAIDVEVAANHFSPRPLDIG